MNERIMQILTELVALKSVSDSRAEILPAEWFENFFKNIPYFEKHPEDTGVYEIPGDPHGRKIPYAFLKGKTAETVLFSGHFDVVSTEEYGSAEPWAYDLTTKELEKKLADMPLDAAARADLESGEWIWGRGTADMKGGLAIHAAIFEQYAEEALKGTLEGSILFVPVPDEESYSTGMRHATEILKNFREKYDLNYKLYICPEPTADNDMKQIMSLGTIGKVMPTILVQGKKGHVGHCYQGFSALGMLAEIYLKTNGSLEFSDISKGEASPPPTWGLMRDMKYNYDASIPHRGCGYFTVLTFETTPEEIMEKVKAICLDAFKHQVEKLDSEYQQFKLNCPTETQDKIYYEPFVITFGELCEIAKKKDEKAYEKFQKELYADIVKKIGEGELNFPNATIRMMEAMLDYAQILVPVIVIGFAPPYYPQTHSDLVKGKEGYGTKAFEFIKEKSEREFNQTVLAENYFTGISDLSYGAVTSKFDYTKYSLNTPLWGDSYSIDMATIEDNGIPGIIYGPIGRNYHQYVERVNKKSLLEIVPMVTKELVKYMWNV